MDGIRKIQRQRQSPKPRVRIDPLPETPSAKTKELKASYLTLPLRHKFVSLIALVSLLTWAFPHETFASVVPEAPLTGPMVFIIGNKIAHIDTLNLQLSKLYTHEQMQNEIDRQLELENRLHDYLAAQGSPLANYAPTLIQLDNWKKIISLANAESGLCEHYPVDKANCWGIGGSNLWYMGSNLEEGILSMNRFLNTYPANSIIKYSQMTFAQMNGLYKQPPAQHWVDNNQSVYSDLTAIENSL